MDKGLSGSSGCSGCHAFFWCVTFDNTGGVRLIERSVTDHPVARCFTSQTSCRIEGFGKGKPGKRFTEQQVDSDDTSDISGYLLPLGTYMVSLLEGIPRPKSTSDSPCCRLAHQVLGVSMSLFTKARTFG